MKDNFGQDLQHLANVVNKLDELGEILDDMLQIQDSVEVNRNILTFTESLSCSLHYQIQVETELNGLQEHLTTLRELHEQFVSYRMAFNKLILEIARRGQYREAAENIVKGMTRQLDSMTLGRRPGFFNFFIQTKIYFVLLEESRVRAHFNAEYGSHLPEDLCLCIQNEPTKWEVIPSDGSYSEVLPFIANDVLTGVCPILPCL